MNHYLVIKTGNTWTAGGGESVVEGGEWPLMLLKLDLLSPIMLLPVMFELLLLLKLFLLCPKLLLLEFGALLLLLLTLFLLSFMLLLP